MAVRVVHSEQAMKEGYRLLRCEDFVRYYVCHGLLSVQMTGESRNLLESVKARKLSYFGHIMRKKSESFEKQITQGTTNRGILHKRQTENNMDGQHSSMDWIHIGQDTRVF